MLVKIPIAFGKVFLILGGMEPLLDFCRRELPLRLKHENVRQIAEGAGVDKWWLSKLIHGRIEDPGVTKIERLATYLRKPREERTAA